MNEGIKRTLVMLAELSETLERQRVMVYGESAAAKARAISAELRAAARECSSNFDDVRDFHRKFGVGPEQCVPHLPPRDVYNFRMKFFAEELGEIEQAYHADDLVKYFDAHLDLAYITLGSAHLANLPWQDGWDLVQRANMDKRRAASAEESARSTGRGHQLDVVKPEGWRPPDDALRALVRELREGGTAESAREAAARVPVGAPA